MTRRVWHSGPREFAWRMFLLVAALIIACCGLTVAVLAEAGQARANKHAADVAQCINTNLGLRQASGVALSEAQFGALKAQRDWWQSVYNAIIQAPPQSDDEREARSHRFNAQFREFLDTLNTQITANQRVLKVQTAQPLGKC